MKFILTVFLLSICFSLSAQWSNTSNQFYNSLAMPVSTETGDQVHPLVIKSFPDSGYFVIWEDGRNGYQVFAQKYNKSGIQLWADNGIPVSSGTNKQHFTYSTSNDYRNYSVAATDSAGGLYLCYADDSITNYVWERLMIQHFKSDGSKVFPGAGHILYTSITANHELAPQLIADGNGGFFVSFMKADVGTMDIFVHCYKDINGTLKYCGGGKMNGNGTEIIKTGVCGNYTEVTYYSTYVFDYKISPDLQKGCNVYMLFSQNGGVPGDNRIQLAYNWLWRAKKDATTPAAHFSKDTVVQFYTLQIENNELTCHDDNNAYVYSSSKLISNGLKPISGWLYSDEKVNGTTVQTAGNINANIITVNERNYINNKITDFFTRVFYEKQQKFESIPYEYTVSPYKPSSIYGIDIPGQNKLGSYSGHYSDTLLYDPGAVYYYSYSLASGGNHIFATGIMNEDPQQHVLLQHLQVQQMTPDSFSIQLKTANKNGVRIGQETGAISYGNPQVTVDEHGNGFFYIPEHGRSTRVSPIGNGADLLWGAMGKMTGNGKINGEYYTAGNPFFAVDPVNGTGVLSWQDDRHPPYVGSNIYMLHLDNLNVAGNAPMKSIKALTNPYGAVTAYPLVLLGSSNKWSTFEAFSDYGGYDITTPVIGILDNNNLGSVKVSVFDNGGPIRLFKGQPYLDRNYTIAPQNNPTGAQSIRLYFTQEQMDALKAADPTITGPEMLEVVKQPSAAPNDAPPIFTPSADDKVIMPTSWGSVEGGYYLELSVTGFSNFFIQGINGALPVTWVSVDAHWKDNADAIVNWQVAEQANVKQYNLQHSFDGVQFTDVCEMAASNMRFYNCIVVADQNRNHYFRVQQTDNDGRTSLSKVVILKPFADERVMLYPNPVHNSLHVAGADSFDEIFIYEVQGNILQKQKIIQPSMDINVSRLASGNYFIELRNAQGSRRYKFIKE